VTEPHVQPGKRPGERPEGAQVSEAPADDWEWRRRIRANPALYPLYKGAVIALGAIITIGGLALVPLPGPGWLIVFFGVGILASEFEPAARLLNWARARLRDWTTWLSPKPWWVKAAVGLATLALVAAIFWALFALAGVPTWMPDVAETQLIELPGLGR
jgi:uncharacterized protein (TIGR02611 family)